jgi:hypothetical protein
MLTDVSAEHVASIFGVEEETKQETRGYAYSCFMLISCLAYSSTLKMEVTCSSFQQTTQCYIPEDQTLHNHCCKNLKSYMLNTLSVIAMVVAQYVEVSSWFR